MWFKNLRLFRITQPLDIDAETLEEALGGQPFRPCGTLEPASQGWVAPLGRHGESLIHPAGHCIMFCMRKQERVLPAAVVREALEEKVAQIEREQGRPVHRKEQAALREELTMTLMPRAFLRSSLTYGYLDLGAGWLVVDAASDKRAEELASLLRRSLGSLPAVPPVVKESPAIVMSEWIAENRIPGDFEALDECELKDPDADGGVVRVKRVDLGAEEVQVHLKAGKRVAKLAVGWNQRFTCLLGEDLSVKRLHMEDMVHEQLDDYNTEDAAARFDADFAIMTGELTPFLERLLEVFGGEESAAYS
ncbi:recombination-associated protein RdgC [Endothiovibrio diazotrophicus]